MALFLQRAASIFTSLTRRRGGTVAVDATAARAQMARIERLYASELENVTTRLVAGRIDALEWRAQFRSLLAEYHLASAAAAKGGASNLTQDDADVVNTVLQRQLGYFLEFARVVENTPLEDAPSKQWRNRARLYAGAGWETFERVLANVKTGMVELPFYPAERTQCKANCNCHWDYSEQPNGDIHCIWQLMPESAHCTTCPARADAASRGNPLIIRGGVILDAGRFQAPELYAA